MNKIVFTDNNAIAFSNNGRILFGCAPKCDLCANSPASWSVEISGVTTKSGGYCENCEEANGTFIVDEAFETLGSPVNFCLWHYSKVWGPCGFEDPGYFRKLRVWVGYNGFTGYRLGVSWIFEDETFELGWCLDLGTTKPDCAAFDDLDVPFKYSNDCLASTSTCCVTAL